MHLFSCLRLPPSLGFLSRHRNSASMPLPSFVRRRSTAAFAATPAAPTMAVQKLFVACRDVFSAAGGQVPPPAGVQRIKAVLDDMTPEDVALTPDMPYFQNAANREVPHITYLHLYECNDFSIGIFCFPRSAVIPLHNHPGMVVFSKLLFGSMHVMAYDWAKDCAPNGTNGRINHKARAAQLAKVKVDASFVAPCETSILFPEDGGNMHSFRAETPCAVLDVLAPPYDDVQGRSCTYYKDISSTLQGYVAAASEDGERYAVLEERVPPTSFVVKGAPYRGPRISEC